MMPNIPFSPAQPGTVEVYIFLVVCVFKDNKVSDSDNIRANVRN